MLPECENPAEGKPLYSATPLEDVVAGVALSPDQVSGEGFLLTVTRKGMVKTFSKRISQ